MIWEAQLAFILFFFFCWCVVGLLPWVISAVVVRGRGALLALPLSLATASAFGVFVPAIGLRDFNGFMLSLLTALLGGTLGSLGGLAFHRRFRHNTPARPQPTVSHALGSRRPDKPPPTS